MGGGGHWAGQGGVGPSSITRRARPCPPPNPTSPVAPTHPPDPPSHPPAAPSHPPAPPTHPPTWKRLSWSKGTFQVINSHSTVPRPLQAGAGRRRAQREQAGGRCAWERWAGLRTEGGRLIGRWWAGAAGRRADSRVNAGACSAAAGTVLRTRRLLRARRAPPTGCRAPASGGC